MHSLPTHISRYEIKSLIGRGGMGDLYLARDPNTNRLVALKLLNATLDSSDLRERFAREARALAALNHPNIVNIYDTGEFDDSPFIVMEYVRGETLAEVIKRRAALSVSKKLKLMAELCAGLAQAHDAGIIHRDIKPANLMVDQQGRLKILDFGIARVAEGNKTRIGLPLTQVNMLIGTPGYMSPEQIEGGEVDHRSDIFAVGAVCYELLAYDEAFSGANTRQIESRVLRGQPAPLASMVPGLDPEIDEIVFRALKRDPNKRYQDAATFERALEGLRSRLGPDTPGAPHRPTPPPPQTARGNPRAARAEAAYQRALAAEQGGAAEAARRLAVEALAEDPSHVAARALLARLQPRAHVVETQSASLLDPSPPTLVGTSAGDSGATMASAPTIIAASTVAGPPAVWKRYEALWRNRVGSRQRRDQQVKRHEQPVKRDAGSPTRHEPLWVRYPRAAQVAAVLVVVAGIVMLVLLIGRWLRPSGQLLTITKPEGGTISAAGINCGTRGTDCSTSFRKGDAVELRPEADVGFAFVGYTGDCAPGGRTVMSAPRTCGATFTQSVAAPPVVTQRLTISPVPTGGTIQGVDIICGTNGSICSANHPDGVPVELHPTADAGFTFMGFVGDCAPLGQTQMTGPRTCGATFSPTAVASANPPPRPAPTPVTRPDRSGGTPAAGGAPPRPTTAPPALPPANPSPSGVIAVTPVPDQKEVSPPQSPEAFAKDRIQELLKEYCHAYEALDPAAVQRVFPTVDMAVLQIQLNPSKYKSVTCKFAEPVFLALNAIAGTAKVQADVKRVFEHTAVKKVDESELSAQMTLSRPGDRIRWQIDAVTYKTKPK
jgi:hypothetical protein